MLKCRNEKVRNFVVMMVVQFKIIQEFVCKKLKGCNFDRVMENMRVMKNVVDFFLV